VCRNCLKGTHHTSTCKSAKCPVQNCNKPHHQLLHEERSGTKGFHGPVQKQSEDGEKKPNGGQHSFIATSAMVGKKPILQTCQAYVCAPGSGLKKVARCFMDSGAELSLMTRDFAKALGLKGEASSLTMSVAGGSTLKTTREQTVEFQLISLDRSFTSTVITATTTKSIVRALRPVEINPEEFTHLKHVKFTESYPREEASVDVLIGVQYYAALLTGEVLQGRENEPCAIATRLGYILSGSA